MDRKVYSCSQFFNELDLLEIKLEILNDLVDFFIISESTFTHSGKPKELIYEKNKDLFKKFHHKIIHQIVTDTPDDYTNLKVDLTKDNAYNQVIRKLNSQTHWTKNIENYGRDSFEKEILIRPLTKVNDCDIILLSDLDEIVKPKALEEIINNFDEGQIYHFQHDVFYYYLNLRKDEPWHGTMVLSYENFKEKSFCTMRQNKEGVFIKNGGWHFSYQGSVENIKTKIESFGEQSLNLPWVKNGLKNNIENAISLGRDLYNRPCKFWIEPITYKTHPKYLVENQDKFRHLIYKEA